MKSELSKLIEFTSCTEAHMEKAIFIYLPPNSLKMGYNQQSENMQEYYNFILWCVARSSFWGKISMFSNYMDLVYKIQVFLDFVYKI